MKLTDEEINEHVFEKVHMPGCENAYITGMKNSRDFYENQICETCGKTSNCQIKDALADNCVFVVIDFGCNQWEEKK